MKSEKLSGFTIVELLVTIGVLGVLIGIVVAVINPSQKRAVADDVVLKDAILSIASSAEVYKNIQGSYPASPSALLPYLTGRFTADANGFQSVDISVGGVKGGSINWVASKICLDARSNTDTTKFLQWKQGTGVVMVAAAASCASL